MHLEIPAFEPERVAHIREQSSVQTAQIDRQRPGAGLDVADGKAVFGGAQRVGGAVEGVADESAQDAQWRGGRAEHAPDRVALLEPAKKEVVSIRQIAVRDAERGAQGQRVVPGNAVAVPGHGEEFRSGRGRLPEGKAAAEGRVGEAQRDRESLPLLAGDAADESARVRPGVRHAGGGEEPR